MVNKLIHFVFSLFLLLSNHSWKTDYRLHCAIVSDSGSCGIYSEFEFVVKKIKGILYSPDPKCSWFAKFIIISYLEAILNRLKQLLKHQMKLCYQEKCAWISSLYLQYHKMKVKVFTCVHTSFAASYFAKL